MVEEQTVEDLIREWQRLGREVEELNALRELRRRDREHVRVHAIDVMRSSSRTAGWIVDDWIYFVTPEGLLDARPIANLPQVPLPTLAEVMQGGAG